MAEIEHPSYYKSGGIECIDVMQKLYGKDFVSNFCLGNAMKYLWRCGRKHETPIDDLKKARFYIDHIVKINEPTGQENEIQKELDEVDKAAEEYLRGNAQPQPCAIELGNVLNSYDRLIDEATKGSNKIVADAFRQGAHFIAKLIEKECKSMLKQDNKENKPKDMTKEQELAYLEDAGSYSFEALHSLMFYSEDNPLRIEAQNLRNHIIERILILKGLRK